jgi:hypothetical protein
VTNGGLRQLRRLSDLEELSLPKTVSDAGLANLAKTKEFHVLNLRHTKVTDKGIEELSGWSLRTLVIPRAAKTDLGLKHYLAAVEAPTALCLDDWEITDAGLEELGKYKTLQRISLMPLSCFRRSAKFGRVTDKGLRELLRLENLRALSIPFTDITDVGIRELVALKRLQTLDLRCTHVSDKGLGALSVMKELRYLDLAGTEVTDAGVAALRKDLAACKIRLGRQPPAETLDVP